MTEEELDNTDVPKLAGNVKRRIALSVAAVDPGAAVEQELDQDLSAVGRSEKQRTSAQVISIIIWIGSVVEQERRSIPAVVMSTHNAQWRFTAGGERRISTTLEQRGDNRPVWPAHVAAGDEESGASVIVRPIYVGASVDDVAHGTGISVATRLKESGICEAQVCASSAARKESGGRGDCHGRQGAFQTATASVGW